MAYKEEWRLNARDRDEIEEEKEKDKERNIQFLYGKEYNK